MKSLYIAAPLFNPQERALNEHIDSRLSNFFKIFLPQRDGILIPNHLINAEEFARLSSDVFTIDTAAIRACDCILAVLDGRTIDEGVSFELGYAYALGKTCIGYRTDARSLLPYGNNPMIDNCLKFQFRSEEDLIHWASGKTL